MVQIHTCALCGSSCPAVPRARSGVLVLSGPQNLRAYFFMKKINLDNLRHSTAHLMAAAVMELWPQAKRTIGPAIENGFYFDFDFGDTKISESDFPKIEAKMRNLLPRWKGFERHELPPDLAKKEYPENPYKHELIDEFSLEGQKLTFYKSGDYWDLCRGGHVDNPNQNLIHF